MYLIGVVKPLVATVTPVLNLLLPMTSRNCREEINLNMPGKPGCREEILRATCFCYKTPDRTC